MSPAAVLLDDWQTLRRATRPGSIRRHLGDAMVEEGLLRDLDLFQDAFDYAASFHRSMTERDLREHTVEQVLSLAMYTLGEPIAPTEPALRRAADRALERNADQVAWYDDAVPFLEAVRGRGLPTASCRTRSSGWVGPGRNDSRRGSPLAFSRATTGS